MVRTKNAKLLQLSSTPWAPGTEIRLKWLTQVSGKCPLMKCPFYCLGNFRADAVCDTWQDTHRGSVAFCQIWALGWTPSGCCQYNGWVWGALQHHHPPGHSLESDPGLRAAVGCFASQLWICGSSGSLWLQGYPIQSTLRVLRFLNNCTLQTQLSHEQQFLFNIFFLSPLVKDVFGDKWSCSWSLQTRCWSMRSTRFSIKYIFPFPHCGNEGLREVIYACCL